MVEQQAFVGNQPDLAFDLQGVFGHGEAQKFDAAGSGRGQAHEHADGRGFAGAIGP